MADKSEDTVQDIAKPRIKKQKPHRHQRKRAQKEAADAGSAGAEERPAKKLKTDTVPQPEKSSSDTQPDSKPSAIQDEDLAPTKSKFLVFIGNLPFAATSQHIAQHLKHLSPTSIRLPTDKTTGKSKGYAFVEFDRFDHMGTCLKLYHHSKLSDGVNPARRINVELTAGGGGAGGNRREKIREKNEKLNGERKKEADRRKNGDGTKTDEAPNGEALRQEQEDLKMVDSPKENEDAPKKKRKKDSKKGRALTEEEPKKNEEDAPRKKKKKGSKDKAPREEDLEGNEEDAPKEKKKKDSNKEEVRKDTNEDVPKKEKKKASKDEASKQTEDDTNGMHPSRLARMDALGPSR
jgi:nucleolar protein 6